MTELQRRLSHKDNRDFKIWYRKPIRGQNYPVQKKEQNKTTTYLLSEALYGILNILLKFLTYISLYMSL